MATVNDQVSNLAAAYKNAGIQIDAATKVGAVAPTVYVDNLLEGLTAETIELVRKNDSLHLAAAAKAVGEASMEACVANKELNDVTTYIPMTGKDTMKIAYQHFAVVNKPGSSDGEKIEKHGSVRAQFDMYGESGSRGQLAAVRDELAAAALAKASK